MDGSPDPQVAAGPTHVWVTAWQALACYTKAGNIVPLGDGLLAVPCDVAVMVTLRLVTEVSYRLLTASQP